MIVDSSAIIAIVTDEPASDTYLEALVGSSSRRISAATLLEAAIVVDRHPNPLATRRFDRLIERMGFTIVPVTAHQATIAREAYRRFGKGSGHPARLNFGDCFAYALAKEFDEPLLFVGQDFVHTDVLPVVPISIQLQSPAQIDGIEQAGAKEQRRPMTEAIDPLEAEHIRRCTPEMREWYNAPKTFMLGLGNNVSARGRQEYVGFWRSGRNRPDRIFAYANFRPSRNQIVIDVGHPPRPVPFDGVFLVPWQGEQKQGKVVHIVVDSDEDVRRAEPIIRQSYEDLS